MKRNTILTAMIMLACLAAGALFGRDWRPRDVQASAPAALEVESSKADVVEDAAAPSSTTVVPASASDTEDNDATAARLIDQANHGEALAWLLDTHAPRGVARWDKQEAIELIKGFYSAGAAKVYAVDTDVVGHIEVVSEFVIVLPSDAQARRKIFEREARFRAQYDEDPTPDSGQKYLLLTTD